MENITKVPEQILQNPFIMAFAKIFLIVYSVQFAPKLSPQIQSFFDNVFVKIAGIALIVWLMNKDYQLAILVAIAFVLSINLINGRGVLENYTNEYADYNQTPVNSGMTLLEPHLDISPGCMNVTMSDLLSKFSNSQLALQNTVSGSYKRLNQMLTGDALSNLTIVARSIGLPYDIQFTDENAPLIASMLLLDGYQISASCQNPHGDSQNDGFVLNDQTTVKPIQENNLTSIDEAFLGVN